MIKSAQLFSLQLPPQAHIVNWITALSKYVQLAVNGFLPAGLKLLTCIRNSFWINPYNFFFSSLVTELVTWSGSVYIIRVKRCHRPCTVVLQSVCLCCRPCAPTLALLTFSLSLLSWISSLVLQYSICVICQIVWAALLFLLTCYLPASWCQLYA